MKKRRYLVVGAGFSGAVLARQLAENQSCSITVLESRSHIAGNCHTSRDSNTNIMVHAYGPHIFNTNEKQIFDYLQKFGEMRRFSNRVKSSTPKGVYSFPINLHTINQFFGKRMGPEEAKKFVRGLGDQTIQEPQNFEEQALKLLGNELYETFLFGYTKKQWGCEPSRLPASILKRLPIRFTYNDEYYDKTYQAIPVGGYTELIRNILRHPSIDVVLNHKFSRNDGTGYDHVFYTGPLDAYFEGELGHLGYRTVFFEKSEVDGDHQGNAVMNYPGMDKKFTRIHEHKHFSPWESHEKSLVFTEYSKETGRDDIPFYPKRLAPDKMLLKSYTTMASQEKGTTFFGRLGSYRYLDMDKVINEALALSHSFLTLKNSADNGGVWGGKSYES